MRPALVPTANRLVSMSSEPTNSTQGSSRKAYQGNLADAADLSAQGFSDAKFFNFDIAGVGLGFHHIGKPDLAAKRLAERLKTGGVLFIVDFVAHEMDPKIAAGRGITHHGFTQEQIRAMFEGAGLGEFGYEELAEPVTFKSYHGEGHGHSHGHGHGHGHGDKEGVQATRRVFIARASKL